MMRVEDYLQDAIQSQGIEILLCSSQKPKLKVATKWQFLDQCELKPSQLREMIFQFLPEEKKSDLIEKKYLEMNQVINGVRTEIQISIAEGGFVFHMRWGAAQKNVIDFAIPQSVIEVFRRGEGLSVITGPRASGKTTLALELIQKTAGANIVTTAMVSDHEKGVELPEAVIFDSTVFIQNIHLVRGFDFVIIDSLKTAAWRQSVQLAEMGVRVLLVLPYLDIQTAMVRLSEKIEAQPNLGLSRIAHCLQIAMSIKLAPSFDQKVQPIYDLLFATREIKEAMLNQDWKKIEAYIQTQGERTGMRTMNQSILGLILKRKIDLKSAFAASPAPDELDQMLEKVGF